MPGTDRVIRDGLVAVLVSTSHGSGWSTWHPADREAMMFDPQLVDIMLSNAEDRLAQVRALAALKYPSAHLDGLDSSFQIHWVPEGCLFRVTEYDGSERIEQRDQMAWIRA